MKIKDRRATKIKMTSLDGDVKSPLETLQEAIKIIGDNFGQYFGKRYDKVKFPKRDSDIINVPSPYRPMIAPRGFDIDKLSTSGTGYGEENCLHKSCVGCNNGTCDGVHMLSCRCKSCSPWC